MLQPRKDLTISWIKPSDMLPEKVKFKSFSSQYQKGAFQFRGKEEGCGIGAGAERLPQYHNFFILTSELRYTRIRIRVVELLKLKI